MLMRSRIVLGLVVGGVALLAVGCSKKPAATDAAPVPATAAAPVNSAEAAGVAGHPIVVPSTVSGDRTANLEALTQALRRYSIEHRAMPKTFAEVIAAGYVKNLAAAPPGKKFEIDSRTSRVVLMNQ